MECLVCLIPLQRHSSSYYSSIQRHQWIDGPVEARQQTQALIDHLTEFQAAVGMYLANSGNQFPGSHAEETWNLTVFLQQHPTHLPWRALSQVKGTPLLPLHSTVLLPWASMPPTQ